MGRLVELSKGIPAPKAVGRVVRDRYREGTAAGEGKAKNLLMKPARRLGNVQRGRYVEKAMRDQNSSPGATIVRRGPVGPGQTPTRRATRGNSPGRFTPGRNEGRDANSSPKVTRIQPRRPDGKYASHEHDLVVVHPQGKRISSQPKTSKLGVHRKGRGDTAAWVKKAYGRNNTRFGMTGSKGRRIV